MPIGWGKQIDQISPESMSELSSYPWPGNIRELQNFMERSVILTLGKILRPPLCTLDTPAAMEYQAVTLEEAERGHIRKTLEQTRWVVAGPNGAAAGLRIKRSTLYFRMQKLAFHVLTGRRFLYSRVADDSVTDSVID
jgi:formate hydrogenlyase transcriptional activator